MNNEANNNKVDSIIMNHVYLSLGAGLVPVPLLDVVAVTAIQVDMLKKITRVYGYSFKEEVGKSYVTAIVSTSLARYGASLIKAIPGLGSIIGGVSMSALSGGTTYALGQAFKSHFSAGGGWEDLDLDQARETFESELEKGKQVAKEMEKERAKKTKEEEEDPFKKLEKLAQLKEKGIVSEAEFNEQKKRLLDSL